MSDLHRDLADKMLALAWQAGIVDGEGCLTIGRQIRKGRPSPAFRPMVTISNTNRDLLTPFLAMWGGAIYTSRVSRKDWMPQHTWHCPDRQITAFLLALGPYLRGKHRQAGVLLHFIANKKKFKRIGLGQGRGSAPLDAAEINFRESLWNEARRLNAKGQFARAGLPQNQERQHDRGSLPGLGADRTDGLSQDSGKSP